MESADPREYASLAAVEANVEKADALLQQSDGPDETQMQGYQDRSKYREVVGTKYARKLILKSEIRPEDGGGSARAAA